MVTQQKSRDKKKICQQAKIKTDIINSVREVAGGQNKQKKNAYEEAKDVHDDDDDDGEKKINNGETIVTKT